MSMKRRDWRNDRGSALVVSIGVLAILAVVVTGVLVAAEGNARLLAKRTDSVTAFYLAEAGIAVAESELLREYAAEASWVTDTSLQGENARIISAPIASLQEVQPRLAAMQVLVDVMDASGVYKIRSSATLSGSRGQTDAAVAKYVVIKPGSSGQTSASKDLLNALNRSVLCGGNLTMSNSSRIEGSAHSNKDVRLYNSAVITGGYTDGSKASYTIPQMVPLADYARDLAEKVRAGYSGGWVTNPASLAGVSGNIHYTTGTWIAGKTVVNGNLWVDGDLSVSNKAVIYGDVFVKGNLDLANQVKVYGRLFVEGTLWISNGVEVDGPVYVYGQSGTLAFSNSATINSHVISTLTVTVSNAVTIRGSLLSERDIIFSNSAHLGDTQPGTAQYGALVYAGGDIFISNNLTIRVASMIAHGRVDVANSPQVLQSGLGIDPSIFDLFPGEPIPAIVDSHWSG